MIHKGQRIHVLYLVSLNNIYPDLDNDLQHFWTRAAQAAQQLHLLSGHAPRTVIHHLQLPCQTNNFDCGIFVIAYQRAVKSWINTYLPSAQTSIDQRIRPLTSTLRQVNQHTATALRSQLRTSLAPHCKVHLRTLHAFSCPTTNDACACLTRIRSKPITIDIPTQTNT
jgi:Ulp1 family protease